MILNYIFFFFSSRRRHTRLTCDWSSDVCSSDLLQREGGDLREFLAAQAEVSRDNGRTPMQWSSDSNAGFSGGMPWIRVNPDYRTVNVAAEERDTGSVLHYFRRMIQLRKSEPVLVYGRYQLLDRD